MVERPGGGARRCRSLGDPCACRRRRGPCPGSSAPSPRSSTSRCAVPPSRSRGCDPPRAAPLWTQAWRRDLVDDARAPHRVRLPGNPRGRPHPARLARSGDPGPAQRRARLGPPRPDPLRALLDQVFAARRPLRPLAFAALRQQHGRPLPGHRRRPRLGDADRALRHHRRPQLRRKPLLRLLRAGPQRPPDPAPRRLDRRRPPRDPRHPRAGRRRRIPRLHPRHRCDHAGPSSAGCRWARRSSSTPSPYSQTMQATPTSESGNHVERRTKIIATVGPASWEPACSSS